MSNEEIEGRIITMDAYKAEQNPDLYVHPSGMTPNDELRALVEDWRETGDFLIEEGPNNDKHHGKGMVRCAEKLEELINE